MVNALAPAEVAKVVLDEDRQRMEVVVPDQQLSLAIGRRGQNVRLASQLTGWDIDIVTEQEESDHRQAEFEKRTKLFIDALNVDEVVGPAARLRRLQLGRGARAGGREGARRHRGLRRGYRPASCRRARPIISARLDAELDARRKELGVEDALKDVPGVTTAMLVAFGEDGIKTVEDLAGCATDDLAGWSERKDGEVVKHPGILEGIVTARRPRR